MNKNRLGTAAQKSVAIGALFLLVGAFQNCGSDKKFSAENPSVTSASAPATEPASATIDVGSLALPTARFVAQVCNRGVPCAASFVLDAVEPVAVSFNWHTNDTLYQMTPPPGSPAYGQPGVNYVSSSGTISIPAGQTSEGISIQNISTSNSAMVIGVLMTNCNFGGEVIDCSKMFH